MQYTNNEYYKSPVLKTRGSLFFHPDKIRLLDYYTKMISISIFIVGENNGKDHLETRHDALSSSGCSGDVKTREQG